MHLTQTLRDKLVQFWTGIDAGQIFRQKERVAWKKKSRALKGNQGNSEKRDLMKILKDFDC